MLSNFIILQESPDSNYIRWSHYVEVHKNDLERDSFDPLRVCPKITHRHLSPDSFSKMNVKLAAQVKYYYYNYVLIFFLLVLSYY